MKGSKFIVEDAMFLARLVPNKMDPVIFYGHAFLKFGKDRKRFSEKILIDYKILLKVETEDGKTIHVEERFLSLGHLEKTANNSDK